MDLIIFFNIMIKTFTQDIKYMILVMFFLFLMPWEIKIKRLK